MGANTSYPKLSGEITINRIRSDCQKDDMPAELKRMKVHSLANDLSAIGMDISTVDAQGRARSDEEICSDIKRISSPDIQSLCMITNRKGDTEHLLEATVAMFNRNYGAQISLYKNPLDPKKGKRHISDVCDDLYLTLDKVHRSLSDEPKVIKTKLEKQIQQLEDRKKYINARIMPAIANLSQARSSDQLNKDIEDANQLQQGINSILNNQLHSTFQNASNIINELDVDNLNSTFGNQLSNLSGVLNIHNSNNGLFATNQSYTDTIGNLLSGAAAAAPAIKTCVDCRRKLGVVSNEKSPEVLQAALKAQLQFAQTNDEVRELWECHRQLVDEHSICHQQDRQSVDLSPLKFNDQGTNILEYGQNIGINTPVSSAENLMIIMANQNGIASSAVTRGISSTASGNPATI